MTIPDFLTSSGSVLMDRRFEYARDLASAGDHTAAIDLLEQSRDIAPEWPVLPYHLGCLYLETGASAQAAEQFKRALALDPADHQGAGIKLQQCAQAAAPNNALPAAFVKTLFDQYAPRFDTHLQDALSYNVPRTIHDMLTACRPDVRPARILDLGCGTGLAAAFFHHQASHITGVDISPGMLAQAAQKQIYDELIEDDLLHFMTQAPSPYDLVLAADVFTYFGDLSQLLLPLPAFLKQGGLLAFSVQRSGDAADFKLENTNRFVHRQDYIDRTLEVAGLKILACEPHVLRQDAGKDVNGLIYLCKKPDAEL